MSTRAQIEFFNPESTLSLNSKPEARIYKHSDGYPNGNAGVMKQLWELKKVVSGKFQNATIFGPRSDDPEWIAAEFINQFRNSCGGTYYVTQNLRPAIRFLYRIVTGEKWTITVYTPHFNFDTGKLESLDFMFTVVF